MAGRELKPVYLITGSDRPKIETALGASARTSSRRPSSSSRAQEVSERTLPRSATPAASSATRGSSSSRASTGAGTPTAPRERLEGRRRQGGRGVPRVARARHRARLVAEELKKDSPLTKACAKAGEVLAYEVAKRNVCQWVAERFRRPARGRARGVRALVQLVGEDFHQLANEIDKLALWAGDEPVGEHEVELLVAAVAETPVFALTDAWGSATRGRRSRRARPSSSARADRGATRRRASPARSATISRSCAAASGSPPRACARATPRRAEAASVLRREGVRAGGELHRGGARDASSGSPRSTTRSRAAAGWRRTSSSQRALIDLSAGERLTLAAERRRLRRARGARGAFLRAAVFLCSAPRDGAPCRPSARARGARWRRVLVARGRRGLEPLRQRLDRRAVAEVLVPLALGDPDALLLLLNVRHVEERPAVRARGW